MYAIQTSMNDREVSWLELKKTMWMPQGGKTAVKVSWHPSDGSGEARAPRPLTRQRGGEKKIF